MNIQKSWTDILGRPEGNEIVWASEIVRKTGQFTFKTLWKFDNHTKAKLCYDAWIQENKV